MKSTCFGVAVLLLKFNFEHLFNSYLRSFYNGTNDMASNIATCGSQGQVNIKKGPFVVLNDWASIENRLSEKSKLFLRSGWFTFGLI